MGRLSTHVRVYICTELVWTRPMALLTPTNPPALEEIERDLEGDEEVGHGDDQICQAGAVHLILHCPSARHLCV